MYPAPTWQEINNKQTGTAGEHYRNQGNHLSLGEEDLLHLDRRRGRLSSRTLHCVPRAGMLPGGKPWRQHICHEPWPSMLPQSSLNFPRTMEHKEKFMSAAVQQLIRNETSSRDGISTARSLLIHFYPNKALKHYANPLEDWVQFWAINPPIYRKKMGHYASEIQGVPMQLTEAIFEGLVSGPLYLQEKLENGAQFLALNNYPQFSHCGDKVGSASHFNYGVITILLQSSPGLEVMHHDDDTWTSVPAISGALHVHIADNLEVLSNDQVKSRPSGHSKS